MLLPLRHRPHFHPFSTPRRRLRSPVPTLTRPCRCVLRRLFRERIRTARRQEARRPATESESSDPSYAASTSLFASKADAAPLEFVLDRLNGIETRVLFLLDEDLRLGLARLTLG